MSVCAIGPWDSRDCWGRSPAWAATTSAAASDWTPTEAGLAEIDAIVPPPAAGRLGPLRPAYPPATATWYKAAAFAPSTGEYETWGESPPCWYPPMTPITRPWPVAWSISLRKGPPLVPSV